MHRGRSGLRQMSTGARILLGRLVRKPGLQTGGSVVSREPEEETPPIQERRGKADLPLLRKKY